MTIRLGVLMDPIAHINPKKDSSFALLLAAQRRGWSIFYMEPTDLLLNDNGLQAYLRALTVCDHEQNWFTLGAPQLCPLQDLQCILMRQDPPVDRLYLHVTQLLALAEASGVRVVNRPQSLRDYNEKLFALAFPGCCPPTLVTQSKQAATEFLAKQQDVIVKPLDGMGGEAIFRLADHDPNKQVVFETLMARPERYFLLQRYIAEIQQGDKRILMVNGEPIPYALARLPAEGETRANLAVGGTGVVQPLTDRDYWICQQIGPRLREKGLLFVGLDVIGDYLTEINITSPTGIRELEAQCGLGISDKILDSFQL